MGSSVKTAFHFRLVSNCCQKASGKGQENTSKEGNQKGSQESNTQKGSSKEGSSKETSSKEGKEAQEGQEASTKKSKEAQEEEGTKEGQRCTKTSNVRFLLVCSR